MQELVRAECERWASSGVDVRYEARNDRAGYKAGNLTEGMRHGYARSCEFVAIFDADFQPAPEFLADTVPLLLRDARLALVQTRWEFGTFTSTTAAMYVRATAEFNLHVLLLLGCNVVADEKW
jgi:beta-mannan synthase